MTNVPIIKQVPPEVVRGKILFAGSDGKFYGKSGKQLKHAYVSGRPAYKGRPVYPHMNSGFGDKECHFLMACAFLHIPDRSKGEVVDHINGDLLNYSLDNIRIIHKSINRRDGGFLRKLRNKGIDPMMYSTAFLLRFFERMAKFKSSHSWRPYNRLTRDDLLTMLVSPEYRVGPPLDPAAEPTKYYDPFCERDDPDSAAHLAPFH